MALIVGGQEAECRVDVADWHQTGRAFAPPEGARRRRIPPDLLVLHWTAMENPPRRVHRALRGRGLGVHICIGRDGEVEQYADLLDVATYHAGVVNDRSVGIEVVNYGHRRRVADIPPGAADRDLRETRINGWRFDAADFYPEQVCAVLALVDAITAAIPSIPRSVPLGGGGDVVDRTMGTAELAGAAGVIGHYHASRRKIDPGVALLEAVRDHFGRHP